MEVEFTWPAPMMPRASTIQNAQGRKGTTADQSSAEPWAAPRSYGGTSGAPAAAAVNVGQPSRAFVIAGCVRFCFAGTGVPLLFFKFGGSCVCGRARQNGQRFLGAPRAVVCIEAAGSVRCVWGARADVIARTLRRSFGMLLAVCKTLGMPAEQASAWCVTSCCSQRDPADRQTRHRS